MAAAVAVMAEQTLESRVARIESDVAHMRSDIAEMKLDIRDFRMELAGVRRELSELKQDLIRGLGSNRVWMLLQSAAILAVMARAFKWL